MNIKLKKIQDAFPRYNRFISGQRASYQIVGLDIYIIGGDSTYSVFKGGAFHTSGVNKNRLIGGKMLVSLVKLSVAKKFVENLIENPSN